MAICHEKHDGHENPSRSADRMWDALRVEQIEPWEERGNMTKTYSGLVYLNGNLLASIDLETTGLKAGFHEPIEIAVVPLNSDFRPLEGVRSFYTTTRPEFPERQQKRVGTGSASR
jgi:DNA polymerase III epsilon subunit-like protein